MSGAHEKLRRCSLWWTPDDLKCSLCRPVAALTHWLDYRLFPDNPALMHTHSIVWFAAVVFMVALVYRKFMGTPGTAGLAALLFLLDGDHCFPVAFVANRGYLLAIFFSLLCLYAHHQWRSTKSRAAMAFSALWLALSLLAEESGASTFAFLLAYAIAVEPGSVRRCALTLAPSVAVITAWWISYHIAGYGLRHVGIYTDPVQEPLLFLSQLVPRWLVDVGSQIAGAPLDFLFVVKPSLHPLFVALYGSLAVGFLVVMLPWLQGDKMARFWLASMILAAIPETVLTPISKNLGFIAIGAFGVIASFLTALFKPQSGLLQRRGRRVLAWSVCAWLLMAHGPAAIAERMAVFKGVQIVSESMDQLGDASDLPDVESRDVVLVYEPCAMVRYYEPGYKAYHHRLLPRSTRALAPGCASVTVLRADEKTLVIQSLAENLFSCDKVGRCIPPTSHPSPPD